MQTEKTDERIDLEKLKEQEKIFFFDDVPLFEDELADNGIATMNVKVVMLSVYSTSLLRFQIIYL